MGRLYVAYGSNMIEEQMQDRCPDAKLLSKEVLYGYQLECRDIYSGAYLNAYENSDSSIPVFVWEIEESDEKNLDEYEGYPHSYIKVDVNTSLGTGMMYVMNSEVGEIKIPSREYIMPVYDLYVREGYNLETIKSFIPSDTRSSL